MIDMTKTENDTDTDTKTNTNIKINIGQLKLAGTGSDKTHDCMSTIHHSYIMLYPYIHQ